MNKVRMLCEELKSVLRPHQSREKPPQVDSQNDLPFNPEELSPIRFQDNDWWIATHIASLGEVTRARDSVAKFLASDEAIEFVDYRVLKNEDMTAFREVISRQAITFSENLRNTVNFSPQLTIFSLSGVNAYLLWSKGKLGKAIRRYLVSNESIEFINYRVIKNEDLPEFREGVERHSYNLFRKFEKYC